MWGFIFGIGVVVWIGLKVAQRGLELILGVGKPLNTMVTDGYVMAKEKPIIGKVRSSGAKSAGVKKDGKIVTVPMDSGIEIGDYVAFKLIDNDTLEHLIGA